MSNEYAEMIRRLRKSNGLTQKALGLACGYCEANADRIVRAWERGEYMPTLSVARALANALHCSLDKIIP